MPATDADAHDDGNEGNCILKAGAVIYRFSMFMDHEQPERDDGDRDYHGKGVCNIGKLDDTVIDGEGKANDTRLSNPWLSSTRQTLLQRPPVHHRYQHPPRHPQYHHRTYA